MKKEFIKDVHVLLGAPIVAALTYFLATTELVNFPYIYLILVSIIISIISLFIIPRYIRKGFESGDRKKLIISILISILAASPFIIALGSWVNYAT